MRFNSLPAHDGVRGGIDAREMVCALWRTNARTIWSLRMQCYLITAGR
jgi:hypothetical protein